LRWRSICIDEEQLRRRSIRAGGEWTTTLTAAASRSTIDKLAMIGADLVCGNVADESVCATIAETITPQLTTGLSTSATAACVGSRFEEKHLAIDTGL
jgi:hypothetical protein